MDARGRPGQAPIHLGFALMTRKTRCPICERKIKLVEYQEHMGEFHEHDVTEEKKDATDQDD